MGAFKSFEAKDIISTPFIVNKSFSFYGDSEFIGSGLDKFIGFNVTGAFYPFNSNDIYDYSLNIFSSQSRVAFTPNIPIVNYTIITDPSSLLDNTSGFIDIPLPETTPVTLYCTFSGNFSFLSDPSVYRYYIASYLKNETDIFQFDNYSFISNNIPGVLISHSFSIPFELDNLSGQSYNNLSIYSAIIAESAPNVKIDPTPTINTEILNYGFIINSQSAAPAFVQPLTGINNTQYQSLIYDSVKQLYYTNYIGNPYPTPEYDTGSYAYSQFNNFLQSYPLDTRYYPTQSGAKIGVINIPSTIYGEYIKPKTFLYQSASVYVYDDGEGNLLNSIDNTKCGNVIYSHGLAIITTCSFADLGSFITSSNTTCSFHSSMTLFETQYKCTIRESEFNFSQNPSIISGSNGELYNFATQPYFDPYITTVGLYNENQDLLAVAKLSQPLPSSRTTDTNIIIRMDK